MSALEAPARVGVPDEETRTLAGSASVPTRTAAADGALFTLATYAAHGVQFVAGVVQKAILGPTLSGYWALMQTFWTFFSLAPLGAQHGATRQIPLRRGRGEFAAAESAAGTGASFGVAAISVAGIVAALVAIVFGGGWAEELRFGLVLLGVTAPLRYLTDVHEVIIQGVKRFDVASATVVAKAILALVVQTAAVWAFGYYGLFLGLVLIELGVFVLWFRLGAISFRRPAFRFSLDRAVLRDLISFGAPLMIYSQVWLLFQAVDSLIVAGALDATRLGYYALAVSVTSYILYLPKSIGATLSPRMAERFGQTGQLASIHHYATDVQRLLAYMFVPLAVAGGYFLFPVLIRQALPDFAPSIEVVKIMVAASFFMALMNMPIKVLLTAGYRWGLTGLLLVCVTFNGVLNYVAVVVLDEGIRGAAAATAISYFVTFLITTSYSLQKVYAVRDVIRYVGEIIVAFAYTYAALRLIDSLIRAPDDAGVFLDGALAVAELALFVIALAPWMLLAERRLKGVSMLVSLARRALKRPGRQGAA